MVLKRKAQSWIWLRFFFFFLILFYISSLRGGLPTWQSDFKSRTTLEIRLPRCRRPRLAMTIPV